MAENEGNQGAGNNEGAEGNQEGTEGSQAAPQQQESPKPKEKPTPPWGSDEEFNPEKAWKLIQDLRSDKEQLKPLADKAKELEDAQKTEQQRLNDRLTEAERKAADNELRALRLEVATDKGLTKAQAKYLTGTTEDELAEAADELLELFAPAEDSEAKPGETPAPSAQRRPRENLTPGAAPSVSAPDVKPGMGRLRAAYEQSTK